MQSYPIDLSSPYLNKILVPFSLSSPLNMGVTKTGNGERVQWTGNQEPGAEVCEQVYSGNPPENSTWWIKERTGNRNGNGERETVNEKRKRGLSGRGNIRKCKFNVKHRECLRDHPSQRLMIKCCETAVGVYIFSTSERPNVVLKTVLMNIGDRL